MNLSDIIIDTFILSPEVTYNFSNTSGSAGADYETSSTLVSPSLASTRFVVQTIITPIVVTVGLLGNVLNILVLVQPTMRTSTNVYLLTLAIADCVYLIFSFTLSFVGCRRRGLSYAAYAFNTYGRTISDMAGNIAVWIIVIFTVERYVAVCHPLHGKVWCTVRRAKLFSLLAAVLCVVNTLPGFFELQIVPTADGHRCQYTSFASSPAYELGYTWWYVTVFTFLPFIFLLIFNSLLIHTLVKAARHRRDMLTDGSSGHRLRTFSSGARGSRFVGERRSSQRGSRRSDELPGSPGLPGERASVCWRSWCCGCRCAHAENPPERRGLCHQTFQMNYTGLEKTMRNGVENGYVHTTVSTVREEDVAELNEARNKLHVNQATSSLQDVSRLRCARKRQDSGCGDRGRGDAAREKSATSSRCPTGGETNTDRACDLLVPDRGGRVGCVPSHSPISRSVNPSPRPTHTHPTNSPCQHSSDSPRQNRRSHEQHKVTLMLIVIVIIFLLCQLPWTVLYLYRAYLSAHDASAVGSDAIKIAGNVVNLLAQVNASGNFYLYSFFSKRFRRTLARLFLFWRRELSHTSLIHL